MNKDVYQENRKVALGLIDKAKKHNPELAEYIRKHFVFDDKNHSMFYTGADTVLEDLMQSKNQ